MTHIPFIKGGGVHADVKIRSEALEIRIMDCEAKRKALKSASKQIPEAIE